MITTYIADQILNLIIAKRGAVSTEYSGSAENPTFECWLGFSTTAPNIDGTNFTEPDPTACPSYGRVRLHVNETNGDSSKWTNKWGTVANATVENIDEVVTNEVLEEEGWGTLSHFGIWTKETGGKLLAYDILTDPDGEPDENGRYPAKVLTMEKNHVAVFRAGTLKLSLK